MYIFLMVVVVAMKVHKTLSFSPEVYEQFSKLVPNVSAELEELMRRRITELTSRGVDTKSECQELKERYKRLKSDYDKQKTLLREEKEWQSAVDLLVGLGLAADTFANVLELIPKFMQKWKGDRFFMHSFLSLAEQKQELIRVERRLSEIRGGVPLQPSPMSPSLRNLQSCCSMLVNLRVFKNYQLSPLMDLHLLNQHRIFQIRPLRRAILSLFKRMKKKTQEADGDGEEW